MMVIFLVGLVSMILMRTLRKDYARYSKDEEMDDMVSISANSRILSWTCVSMFDIARYQRVGASLAYSCWAITSAVIGQ